MKSNKLPVKIPTFITEKIRDAIVPVKYDIAVRALVACQNIHEAKLYADKADALAAWAKIYQDDQVRIEARRLKLHAYRRMGTLARELQPGSGLINSGGSMPGLLAKLKEFGLSRHNACAASAISKISDKEFRKAIESVTPLTPSAFLRRYPGSSDAWKTIVGQRTSEGLQNFCAFCRKHEPKLLARSLTLSEAKKAKLMATDATEWLDTFDQYLKHETDEDSQK